MFGVIIDRHIDKGSPLGGQDSLKKLKICDRGDIVISQTDIFAFLLKGYGDCLYVCGFRYDDI